jgi:calpain-15
MLGTCYFLASLSAIAEKPDRIKRLFLSRKINKAGIYCVSLCINGIFEEIILDDTIPMTIGPNGKDMISNKTKTNELWAMLIEKAYAKVHGGYMNIDGGLTREALKDLTGAPTETFFSTSDNPDMHWRRILDGEDKNHIMTAQTSNFTGKNNDSRDKETGLCGNHAYSLLAAYEIDFSSGKARLVTKADLSKSGDIRIVKLRNPWGNGEWKGAWSDSDTKNWTSEIKQLVDYKKEDDGIFYMPFKDFLKYFQNYQVCYFTDNYKLSGKRYNSSYSKPTVIKFEIHIPGDYFFSFNQINKRFFKSNARNFQIYF